MRDCNAHKGYRTGKCRYTGCQNAGEQYKQNTECSDIQPHIPGIRFPHLISTDRFWHHENTDCRNTGYYRHHFDILPGHTGKTSLGPVVEIHDIRIICKSNDEICHCRTDITDHNTADNEHGHLIDHTGHKNHKSHTDHGPCKCSNNHHPWAEL